MCLQTRSETALPHCPALHLRAGGKQGLKGEQPAKNSRAASPGGHCHSVQRSTGCRDQPQLKAPRLHFPFLQNLFLCFAPSPPFLSPAFSFVPSCKASFSFLSPFATS